MYTSSSHRQLPLSIPREIVQGDGNHPLVPSDYMLLLGNIDFGDVVQVDRASRIDLNTLHARAEGC